MVDLATRDHGPPKRQGLRRHGEPHRREAGGKPRQAQQPHRVFGKGIGNVTQHPRGDVGGAAKRVDQAAVCGLGDGVDAEIAPGQILLQRHRRIGIDHEATIAPPGLALGPGQSIFLVALRVQENRKVPADRLVAKRQHLFRRAAYHHPVAVPADPTEQPVAHGAADQIGLHLPFR